MPSDDAKLAKELAQGELTEDQKQNRLELAAHLGVQLTEVSTT